MSSELMNAVYMMERNFLKFPEWELISQVDATENIYEVLKKSDNAFYEKAIEYYRSMGMYLVTPKMLKTIVNHLERYPERTRLYNDLFQRLKKHLAERPITSFYRENLKKTETNMEWKEGVWKNAVEPVQAEPDTSKFAYTPKELPQYCACGIAWDSFLYGSECASCGEEKPELVARHVDLVVTVLA